MQEKRRHDVGDNYGSRSSIGRTSRIRRTMTEPLSAPETNVFPSGEKTTSRTSLLWSESVATHDPSLVLHNRTVRSHDAEATYFPHGEKEADQTRSTCPSSDNSLAPVCASQIITVRDGRQYVGTVSTVFPSGEKAICCASRPGVPLPHGRTASRTSPRYPPRVARISMVPVADVIAKRVLAGLKAPTMGILWNGGGRT